MTRVSLCRRGDRFSLSALGHATGSAAVCAAVSAIVYALAGYARHLSGRGDARAEEVTLEPGRAVLRLRGTALRGAFEMAVIGLLQVELASPGYISVEYDTDEEDERRQEDENRECTPAAGPSGPV